MDPREVQVEKFQKLGKNHKIGQWKAWPIAERKRIGVVAGEKQKVYFGWGGMGLFLKFFLVWPYRIPPPVYYLVLEKYLTNRKGEK